MCIGGTPRLDPAPPAVQAPTVLEQDAPKKAKKTASEAERKKKGTKAFRTDLTIGGVTGGPSSGSTSLNIS